MTQEYTLRAMATNYAGGHSWDHLDGETCTKAADEIKDLRAARPSFQPENVRAWLLATPFTHCSEWPKYVEHMLASLTQQNRNIDAEG